MTNKYLIVCPYCGKGLIKDPKAVVSGKKMLALLDEMSYPSQLSIDAIVDAMVKEVKRRRPKGEFSRRHAAEIIGAVIKFEVRRGMWDDVT